ncbi:ankyrin repeat-containing domain protein [Annulohypoxylon nitens]|nr:ankyrin repeat-containing domain protein [Annulohypoxylon nitens]
MSFSSLKHSSRSKTVDACLAPSPEPPSERIPLYICTPRAASPAVVSHPEYEYPRSLPWIQFSEYLLPQLMSGLRLLPPDDPETTITTSNYRQRPPRKRRPINPSVNPTGAWTAFQNLARRSIEIVIGSEELSRLLSINRSVDRIAAYFDSMLPPTYPGENLRRAIALSGESPYEMQGEVVKVLMFLASNHLIMNGGPLSRGSEIRKKYADDAKAVVDVFRFSGLSQPAMLLKIVRLSHESLTLTSLIDLLYEAAVNTEADDIVIELLATDNRIDINRPVGKHGWNTRMTALEYALVRGSLVLARRMIGKGADVNRRSKSFHNLSPLSLAMLPETDLSVQLVGLLLERGADMNDQVSEALFAAVFKGSIELIDLLYRAGADFASIRLTKEEKIDLEALINHDEGWYHPGFQSMFLNTYNCLGLAASYADLTTPYGKCKGHGTKAYRERTALELVRHILDICGADFDIDNQLKSDAMIFAELQGYTDVILFLYQRGARVDARNGFFCPVYAAVSGCHVECCRLLLNLGGSAQPSCRPLRCYPIQLYSPLHVAVEHDSPELLDLLLQSGADVNSPCVQCQTISRKCCSGFTRQLYSIAYIEDGNVKALSPLGLALEVGRWEVASLLLDRGATSTDGSINCAVEDGQSQLVNRLLKLRADSDKTTQEYRDALEISIREGHESISLNLIESGVPTTNSTLSLALHYGRIRIVVKIIDTGIQLTGPEFAGLFRIPDISTVQSLLQDTPCDKGNMAWNSINFN